MASCRQTSVTGPQVARLGSRLAAPSAPATRSHHHHRRSTQPLRAAEAKGKSDGEKAPDHPGASQASKKSDTDSVTAMSVTGSLDEQGKPKPILTRQSLSGGVKNATARFELPKPAVAVRNLVEQAQYGHLSTVMSAMHHKRAGYPFGSVVDFACDGAGNPIFSLSPLAMHTRNILEDPRCTLVVQMPGWQGLSNARVTIFGEIYRLPESMQGAAREIFEQKHATDENQSWIGGGHAFYRMHHISDIYFVGGFGTVTWVDLKEFSSAIPDPIVINRMQVTLQELNLMFGARLKELLSPYEPLETDDAAIISIDKMGIDVRVRFGHDYNVERVGFNTDVHTLEDAKARLKEITASKEVFSEFNRSAGPKQDNFALFSADLQSYHPRREQ